MSDQKRSPYGWDKETGLALPDKIKLDLKTALKNKDHGVRDALRQIMSEYPGLTVPLTLESGKKTTRPKKAAEITDDDVLDIIRKLIKSEKIVLEARKEETSAYLQALTPYLPQMAGREEITAWITASIDFKQFKSPMQAMGPIMKHFAKQADGNLVKKILQEMTP